ncbi:MAG: RDD family protein [Bacillota bacterium]
MQKIKIQTTQNVTVEYEIAGVGKRIAASLIDLLIVLGYVLSLVFIPSFFKSLNIPGAVMTILFVPAVFYDLLCELIMDGQSFGKKAMNIKVIKLDGGQPTFISYFLRWILRLVDIVFTYGTVATVTMLINGKGQRLGDIAANTTVISTKTNVSLSDTILTELSENYQVVYPQAAVLTDKDAGLIKEVLDRLELISETESRDRLLLKTLEVLSQKLNVVPDIEAQLFLTTILKDYNYLNGK